MGSLSIWHWLIVLVVVVLIFGTGKLKNLGSDLGQAVKGFKDGMRDGQQPDADTPPAQVTDRSREANTVDVDAKAKH